MVVRRWLASVVGVLCLAAALVVVPFGTAGAEAAGGGRAGAVGAMPAAPAGVSLTGLAAPGASDLAVVLALQDLKARSWRPGPRLAPHVSGMQVVGLETWLAVDPVAWVPVLTVATDGVVTVEATATPKQSVWVFSDQVVRCDGPGVAYTPGAAGPAPCGRDWEHTTAVAPMSMRVFIDYEVTWVSSTGETGTVSSLEGNSLKSFDLTVGEIQSVGTLGDDPHPDDPGLTSAVGPVAPACTLVMMARGECDQTTPSFEDAMSEQGDGKPRCELALEWDAVGNCVKAGIDLVKEGLAQLGEWAIKIYEVLPGPLKVLIDLLAGCASFGIDAIKGVAQAFSQAKDALGDPQAYVQEQVQTVKTILDAVSEDPLEFAQEFVEGELELDLLRENPAQWIGKIGCEVAVAVLTAGAGASTRMSGIYKRIDDIRDWATGRRDRDRDGKPDDDADNPTCPIGSSGCGCNSFPTGTLVLLADGTYRPIEAVSPGERVVTYDTINQRWRTQPVLAQWSALDTGAMATATLTSGATITATDDHRFWVDNHGAWIELDQVRPGDHLLTPHGVTTVAAVTTTAPGQTLVWELDIPTDDNFTVTQTASPPVLVHNGDCGPGKPLDWSRRDANGLSAKDHIRRHNVDDPTRQVAHGIFSENAINQTADAWSRAKELKIEPKLEGDRWVYEIPSPGAGTQGGNPNLPGHGQQLNTIRIVTEAGSNTIITAFPVP